VGLDAVTALDAALIVVLIALLVICGITDVLSQRILNLVTLPALVMGVMLNLAFVLIDWRMGCSMRSRV
jgi:Flp pilus assembly protein protease CpaA